MRISYANAEIMELGGYPYSIEQYQVVSNIDKSTLSRKRKNFDKLREWINVNENNPTKLFNVQEDQLLLKYVSELLFDTTGKRQTKSE
jgi:hypothetical protein